MMVMCCDDGHIKLDDDDMWQYLC